MFRLRLVPLSDQLNLVFVRPEESTTNYVLLREEKAFPLVFKTKITQSKAARSIMEELSWTFGQLFHLEGRMCVLRGGQGFWLSTHLDDVIATEFRAITAPQATDSSSSDHWYWLQNEWNKPESEVRFAWEWHGWNENDKHRFYCEHVPHWRELHELMCWAAQVEGLPTGATWWQDHIYFIHRPEVEKRLLLWNKVFGSHFRKFKRFPRHAPLCLVEHFLEHPRVKGQPTSAHERIKARLRLREWLEQNAPDRIDLLPA